MTTIKQPSTRCVALVTGAAGGIGADTALALAKPGIVPVLAVRAKERPRTTELIVGARSPCLLHRLAMRYATG